MSTYTHPLSLLTAVVTLAKSAKSAQPAPALILFKFYVSITLTLSDPPFQPPSPIQLSEPHRAPVAMYHTNAIYFIYFIRFTRSYTYTVMHNMYNLYNMIL